MTADLTSIPCPSVGGWSLVVALIPSSYFRNSCLSHLHHLRTSDALSLGLVHRRADRYARRGFVNNSTKSETREPSPLFFYQRVPKRRRLTSRCKDTVLSGATRTVNRRRERRSSPIHARPFVLTHMAFEASFIGKPPTRRHGRHVGSSCSASAHLSST